MVNRSILLIMALLLLVAAFPATSVPTPTLAQPAGSFLVGLAVNPTTNRIYVGVEGTSNGVVVIDGTNNAVIATIPISDPSGLLVNPNTNRIYARDKVIDGATNTVVASIPMAAGAVNPNTDRIYGSPPGSHSILVVDGASNNVVATIPIGVPSIPIDVGSFAVNPNTNRIYAGVDHRQTGVLVVDGANNNVITSIRDSFGFSPPPNVVVNPTTNRIYAGGRVIDGETNTLVASIPLDATAVNPTTNRIYGPERGGINTLVVVDGASNAVVATLPFAGIISVNPTTNRIYVSFDNSIKVIDGASNSVIATIPIPAQVPSPTPPPPPRPGPSPTPSPTGSTWFFAEGSTQAPFDTWFLVENPTNQAANVTFTFFLQPSGTITQNFAVGPTSRFSLFANQVIPNVAFSARIDANQPVFAERAMYVSSGYDGDVVTGIPAPNKLWLFAEGATVVPFHTWLLLQNPNNVAAGTTITYLLESGQTATQVLSLPPNSRTSIFVNQVLPNAAFSSQVQSDHPIVAERAMYRCFPCNGATANSGVNAPSTAWFFSEARTDFRGLNADTFLLLENPGTTQATVTIALFATDGSTLTFPVAVLPTSRLTIFIDPIFGGSFGLKVTSDQPIIAERSVFFGNEPLGAYSTQGATALSTSWHFADGETRDPFDELITVLNPQGQTMGVHIDFELESGQVIGRDFSIAPNSKLEVPVDDILDGANSATVTTSLPSVAERTMFIFKQGSIGATDTIGVP